MFHAARQTYGVMSTCPFAHLMQSVIIMFLHLFQFYDGLYSLYLRTFHASNEPEVVRSTSNTMAVIFISYHNVGHRGFRARYTSDEASRM
jgi:hypothetical protein